MPALGTHEARARLEERIKPWLVVIGASGTEGGDGGIDEARVQLRQRVVINAIALRSSWTQIFDHDISFPHQIIHDLTPFRAVQIHGESTFPLVPTEEPEPEGAKRVPLEGFDFDHIRAELRQDHWTKSASNVTGEVKDKYILQRGVRCWVLGAGGLTCFDLIETGLDLSWTCRDLPETFIDLSETCLDGFRVLSQPRCWSFDLTRCV